MTNSKGVRDRIDPRIKYWPSEGAAWKCRPILAQVTKVADRHWCIIKRGVNGDTLAFCRDHRWRKFAHTKQLLELDSRQ